MSRKLPSHSDVVQRAYTDDEREWLRALQRYKLIRPNPDWSEVLAVARALGYRRVAEPDPEYASLVNESKGVRHE